MYTYARARGEDEEFFGLVGMLHDVDHEKYTTPEEHPYTGVPRKTLAAQALFAFDKLTGFIFAVTFVRPSKSMREVTPKSVQKKLKQRSFAALVNRDDIEQDTTELGVGRDEHIQFTIDVCPKAMKNWA